MFHGLVPQSHSVVPDMYEIGAGLVDECLSQWNFLIDPISTEELTTFYAPVKKTCKRLNINNSVFTWQMTSKL